MNLPETDDNLSKLDVALSYIEQGSLDSACQILNEVIREGDERAEAGGAAAAGKNRLIQDLIKTPACLWYAGVFIRQSLAGYWRHL